MKITARIVVISFVFTLLAVMMVMVVNASGANSPRLGGGRADQVETRPFDGGGDGAAFRPEGERGGRGAGGSIARWIFGLVKDVGVIAFLVTAIVWPKSIAKRKRKEAALRSTPQGSKGS